MFIQYFVNVCLLLSRNMLCLCLKGKTVSFHSCSLQAVSINTAGEQIAFLTAMIISYHPNHLVRRNVRWKHDLSSMSHTKLQDKKKKKSLFGHNSFLSDAYSYCMVSHCSMLSLHRECTRGGFCNFMHLKPISRELRRELYGRRRKRYRKSDF